MYKTNVLNTPFSILSGCVAIFVNKGIKTVEN